MMTDTSVENSRMTISRRTLEASSPSDRGRKMQRIEKLEWIERPITSGSISFSPDNASDIERAKATWPFLPIHRIWSFGIKREELVKWFDSIPPEITAVLHRMLSRMHCLLIKRSETVTSDPPCDNFSANSNDFFDNPFRSMEESDEIGDLYASESYVYTRIEYDPVTQERKSAFSNRRGSFIEHMHREEYLARMASHDLAISMPYFDFLCFFMDDCLRYSEQRLERCFRYNKWSKSSGGAMLLHSTTIRSFDSGGRISKARWLPAWPAIPCMHTAP